MARCCVAALSLGSVRDMVTVLFLLLVCAAVLALLWKFASVLVKHPVLLGAVLLVFVWWLW